MRQKNKYTFPCVCFHTDCHDQQMNLDQETDANGDPHAQPPQCQTPAIYHLYKPTWILEFNKGIF